MKPLSLRHARWRVTSLTLMGAVVLLFGSLFINAGPAGASPTTAAASVGCWGDWCSGQDPVATGCDADAVTLDTVYADNGGGKLDIRWSPTCQTNWARWQQYPTGWCLNCSPAAIVARQDTGYTQTYSFEDNGVAQDGQTYWTPMIYSPQHHVYAGAYMYCGDSGLFSAAMDCALNGLLKTPAY